MIMNPGPPFAKALPVPRKTPLPILEPREIIWKYKSQIHVTVTPQKRTPWASRTYMNLARSKRALELTIPAVVQLGERRLFDTGVGLQPISRLEFSQLILCSKTLFGIKIGRHCVL